MISRVLGFTHVNYLVPFVLAASVYLLAFGAIHLLPTRIEKMAAD